jgi:hypothetical protein
MIKNHSLIKNLKAKKKETFEQMRFVQEQMKDTESSNKH